MLGCDLMYIEEGVEFITEVGIYVDFERLLKARPILFFSDFEYYYYEPFTTGPVLIQSKKGDSQFTSGFV